MGRQPTSKPVMAGLGTAMPATGAGHPACAVGRWDSIDTASLAGRLGVGVLVLDRRWLVSAAGGRAVAMLAHESTSGGAALLGVPLDRCLALDDRGAGGSVAARVAEAIDRRQGLRLRCLALTTRRAIDLVLPDAEAARHADAGVVLTLIDATERAALEAELDHMRRQVAEAERTRSAFDAMREELSSGNAPPTIVGSSRPVLAMLDAIRASAPTSSTVLILGETGTGKELVARAVHAASPRCRRALVTVNCAALPESLLESELFGHERGAFAGSDRRRMGKFELADGGTLFLDEIGELSLAAQAKLLRVLQEGAFERVGGSETIRVDVRVVAATHSDLVELVRQKKFREDLFYRLNVFRIAVPSLRERKEDIRELAEHLHRKHATEMGRAPLPISERSLRRLYAYNWPGNVRELDNAIERATLLAFAGNRMATELEIELPEGVIAEERNAGGRGGSVARQVAGVGRDVLLDLTLDQLQRLQIVHALERSEYRVFGAGGAAELLGIHPQTLLSRMDKLGIPRPRAARGRLRMA
jgi:transcriptional regulator with GAF, ATPase, and Fis domain